MTRAAMINEVIRKYGHEAKITIWFCGLAENPDNTVTYIKTVFIRIMNS